MPIAKFSRAQRGISCRHWCFALLASTLPVEKRAKIVNPASIKQVLIGGWTVCDHRCDSFGYFKDSPKNYLTPTMKKKHSWHCAVTRKVEAGRDKDVIASFN